MGIAEIIDENPPNLLKKLSYNEYQNIRFIPEKSLRRESQSRFQVMLISPGLFYGQAVTLNIIDADGIHPLPFRRDYFSYADRNLEKRISQDLGYAGFKLTYPLRKKEGQNQFMVFAGASYFRAVGRENGFGLSCRGVPDIHEEEDPKCSFAALCTKECRNAPPLSIQPLAFRTSRSRR